MRMNTAGLYVLLGANIVLSLSMLFLKSYTGKKGENVATKEDIGEITAIVKRIETDHAAEIEWLKSHHQLRLAAVDKRLEAHQAAFRLWRELVSTLETDKAAESVLACDKWWSENCLYLEPTAREAFSNAYWGAQHYNYMRRRAGSANYDDDIFTNKLNVITGAGELIVRAVQLPGLTAGEREQAEKKASAARGN
jgi:hypothetical protein